MKEAKNGQSLLEVLVALGVAVLVVLALVGATTIAIRNASFARSQAQATKYAQETMEWLRAERDNDWLDFSEKAGVTYCLSELNWNSPIPCSVFALGDTFKREVVLTTDLEGDKIEAKVTVSWREQRKTYQSQLYSYFTKWQ